MLSHFSILTFVSVTLQDAAFRPLSEVRAQFLPFHISIMSLPRWRSLSETSVFSVQSAGKDRAGDLEGDGDLIRHLRHETRGAVAGLQVLWLFTVMASVIHAVK